MQLKLDLNVNSLKKPEYSHEPGMFRFVVPAGALCSQKTCAVMGAKAGLTEAEAIVKKTQATTRNARRGGHSSVSPLTAP